MSRLGKVTQKRNRIKPRTGPAIDSATIADLKLLDQIRNRQLKRRRVKQAKRRKKSQQQEDQGGFTDGKRQSGSLRNTQVGA